MEKDQTDIHKTLKLLLRRKWLWITTTIVFTIGAAIYALNTRDIYESRCVLIVEKSSVLANVLAERGVTPDTGEILEAVSERMLGWESVVKVIKTVGLDKGLPEDDPSALERMYHLIIKSITLTISGGRDRDRQGGQLITISYKGVNPELNF